MQVDELTRIMRNGEAEQVPTSPDLTAIRSRGRRMRWSRRGATSAVVAATLAVVAGSAYTVAGGPGIERGLFAAGDELSPVAERALKEVPGAYRVGDQVFVPEVPTRAAVAEGALSPRRFRGEVVPLTVHGYSDLTYLTDGSGLPGWLPTAPEVMEDDTVRADNGPLSLACVSGRGSRCGLTTMVRSVDGDYYRLSGLGTATFLKPGAPMEVFLDEDYLERTVSVIGGIHGTDVARVEVFTVDGRRREADVSHDVVKGDTVFWGESYGEVARVVAYDRDGTVLDSHEIKPCDDPVDCEVR